MNTRIYVEKKPHFSSESETLRQELNENLNLNISTLRQIVTYDIFGIDEQTLEKATHRLFGEIVTDTVTSSVDIHDKPFFATEFLPGQFDQRAQAAMECVSLINPSSNCEIRSGKIIILDYVTEDELKKVKSYLINEIEAREKDLSILENPEKKSQDEVKIMLGFKDLSENEVRQMRNDMSLAMTEEDLLFVQSYFKKEEQRDPFETEIKMLDTYWSDHCRHTTFETEVSSITVSDGLLKNAIDKSLETYLSMRENLGRSHKEITLMDMATIAGKHLVKEGFLTDLEVSEENNACSVHADVKVDGVIEKYLIMFKNETHNHPTEIEPFGGASTCIGGAIRDPLSGRSYVYQAMRVTGAGNILEEVKDTMPNKLPQRVISKKSAKGYSSYGNQIGLATTHVKEIFHQGFKAKRLEVGACLGCAPLSNVVRKKVSENDVVVMFGGRTGRDGIGGATGSSKEHNETSLSLCASEVQKGNAPEERKIQHLMRRKEVTRLIKKSNDFGAGGVSVAIGELASSILIDLDKVKTKYAGLNGTEVAISESQERMSVVLDPKDVKEFLSYCEEENLEAVEVAKITASGRLQMTFKGKMIVDIKRSFIDTNGVRNKQDVTIANSNIENPFVRNSTNLKEDVLSLLEDMNVQTQKGLSEMFDSTIGATTVLMPFGGKHQLTETQVSCQKVSLLKGNTDDCTIMSYGYDPHLSEISPFLGSQYAVLDSVAKAVAAGGKFDKIHFTFQEYFERLGADKEKWGKPLQALLGVVYMQDGLKKGAIGGKDSMSGTYKDLNVPPTLISFCQTMGDAKEIISNDLKSTNSKLYLLSHSHNPDYTVNIEVATENFKRMEKLIEEGKVLSVHALGYGGVIEGIAKMSFGNKIPFEINLKTEDLFKKNYGSFLIETEEDLSFGIKIGNTTTGEITKINNVEFSLDSLISSNFKNFAKIYKMTVQPATKEVISHSVSKEKVVYPFPAKKEVKVFIPIFPGTNCDYDTKRAFEKEGAKVDTFVFNNLTEENILRSIDVMSEKIAACDILAFSGGFSSGDEPDGSGKFIANVILNEKIKSAIDELLSRKGLILGICNGFQALVKSGYLPFGNGEVSDSSPTLFHNQCNRHISQIAQTKVLNTNSPWLSSFKEGDLHQIAFSHGEGKFMVSDEVAAKLFENGQVCFQYVDLNENPTMESPFNPNGSDHAIEGITSPCGQILGKMGHSERTDENLYKNIYGDKDQNLFRNAVNYFLKK